MKAALSRRIWVWFLLRGPFGGKLQISGRNGLFWGIGASDFAAPPRITRRIISSLANLFCPEVRWEKYHAEGKGSKLGELSPAFRGRITINMEAWPCETFAVGD